MYTLKKKIGLLVCMQYEYKNENKLGALKIEKSRNGRREIYYSIYRV